MSTAIRTKVETLRLPLAAWLPLVVLPVGTAALTAKWPAWGQMWALAVSIYAGCKWLTFAASGAARKASVLKAAGYLLLWTGMDAEAFFGESRPTSTRWSQWAWAVGQTLLGIWLLFGVTPVFIERYPLVAGWVAMMGIVSVLHFGVSQFASLVWRLVGVNAQHIMHKPLLATSLADFWGRRWNLAFRDLMHQFVLRPLAPHVGVNRAMMAVFLVSGLIHDAVISLAARGGWGLPTLYFLLQGAALSFERSRTAKRISLGRGLRGWIFTAAVVVLPSGLLFHPPFILNVVVPMTEALSGAWR